MHYTEEALEQINKEIIEIRSRYHDLIMKISIFSNRIAKERAKEYILHGVMRRLFILYRCLENIITLFPADRVEMLAYEARIDLEINLHCFLINTYGLIENLALAIAIENEIVRDEAEEKRQKNQLGLFKKTLMDRMSPELRDYLNNPQMRSWYHEYARNYRDALAHRIPPYVPPSGLNKEERLQFEKLNKELAELSKQGYSQRYSEIIEEQSSLGIASPFYLHSLLEKAKPLYLHSQVIADYRTIEELIAMVIANFKLVATTKTE